MIVAAHQTMMGPQGAPLPYDAEVEYLEAANTTSIIDTGIESSTNLTFEIDALYPAPSGSNYFVFGARGSGTNVQNIYLLLFDPSADAYRRTRWAYGDGSPAEVNTVFATGTRTTYSNTNAANTIVASGVGQITCSRTSTFSQKIHFGLFSAYTPNAAASYSGERIYGARLYESAVLVRDFQPVRVGQVGYLYDRVSGTLFGNAGTGAFTIGPDKT